jgi:CRP-like cAMP-binding protein
VLQQVDIFHGVSRDDLLRVARICEERVYPRGDLIVLENTPGDELFIIIDGSVDVILDSSLLQSSSNHPREPQVVATLWAGQTFGEIGLVDQGMRSASVRAASDATRVFVIDRQELSSLCDADPQFGYVVMRNIAADLAYKIRNTDLLLREGMLYDCPSDRAA